VEPLRKKLSKKRKGTIWSLPLIFVFVVISLFIGLSIAYWILEMAAGLGVATAWSSQYIATVQGIISAMDVFILFTFAVMYGLVVVRVFQMRTHHVYGVVGLLGLPIVVIVTGYSSNLVSIFTSFEFLGSAVNQFQYTLLFIQSSPLIIGAASVLVLLVMVGGGVLARR